MTVKPLRPVQIEGDIAYIPLTRGHKAIIDAADAPLVDGYNWHVLISRRADGSAKAVYARSWEPVGGGGRRNVLLHRVLSDAPSAMCVDHIDGDGLNNRRRNLRCVTNQQNVHNQRTSVKNTSGVKGVSRDKRDGKWRAHITLDGKRRFLGAFKDIAEAAAAYAKASAELHGQFGRTS